MGKTSRDKGAAHERYTAQWMRKLWPSARRGIGQARSACEIPDVEGTPLWVETKHRRAMDVHGAFAQGVRELLRAIEQGAVAHDAGQDIGLRVLVVSRRHGSARDLVTMDAELFQRLVELALRHHGPALWFPDRIGNKGAVRDDDDAA